MQRRTPCLVMAGAALVLAAVATAGADFYPRAHAANPEASTPAGPTAGQDKPTVSYWHVWTDDNGVSRQKRCELSAFQFQSIPGIRPPSCACG